MLNNTRTGWDLGFPHPPPSSIFFNWQTLTAMSQKHLQECVHRDKFSFRFFIPTHFKIADMFCFGSLLSGGCKHGMLLQGHESWELQVRAGWPGRVLIHKGALPPRLSREGPVMEPRVNQQDRDHQAPATVQDRGQEGMQRQGQGQGEVGERPGTAPFIYGKVLSLRTAPTVQGETRRNPLTALIQGHTGVTRQSWPPA